eukprot:1138198-Pelagomonas_calceolata.AAC.9
MDERMNEQTQRVCRHQCHCGKREQALSARGPRAAVPPRVLPYSAIAIDELGCLWYYRPRGPGVIGDAGCLHCR